MNWQSLKALEASLHFQMLWNLLCSISLWDSVCTICWWNLPYSIFLCDPMCTIYWWELLCTLCALFCIPVHYLLTLEVFSHFFWWDLLCSIFLWDSVCIICWWDLLCTMYALFVDFRDFCSYSNSDHYLLVKPAVYPVCTIY